MNQTVSVRSSFKKAFLISGLSFLIVLMVFTFNYISKFEEDIFYKNLDWQSVLLQISLSSTIFVSYALLIVIPIFSYIYYKETFRNQVRERKRILLLALIISFFSFIWIAFLSPYLRLQEVALLYDIRSKVENKPLSKTDVSLFKGQGITSNFFELNKLIDSYEVYANRRKFELINIIKSNANDSQIKELLNDESASIIYLTEEDFEIPKDSSLSNNQTTEFLKLYQAMTANEISGLINKKKEMEIELYKMISFPILIFILYFMGIVISHIFRRKIKTTGGNIVL